MKRSFLVVTGIVLLIVLVLILVQMNYSNSYQKININGPAYMYGDSIDQVLPISIEGKYNKKKDSFIGSMEIDNRIKLDNVLFIPGADIIFYEGSKRTDLGRMFFDNESLNYSMEITDPVFYEKLTKSSSDGKAKVIISSPSNNYEQAQRVNEELRNRSFPWENSIRSR
ncbi:hypothetical protein ACFSTH_12200 [Paenibacillus yanchengensis]|uniref:Uncharacterized protein n=1 Tax=Paenibacillus yanchengensis TaxID=2035833 RepID=A0ABW4YMZ9_9BACL